MTGTKWTQPAVSKWVTAHGDRVTVYAAVVGIDTTTRAVTWRWRYRVQARNGQVVEAGSEGYTRRAAALKAARRHHPVVES